MNWDLVGRACLLIFGLAGFCMGAGLWARREKVFSLLSFGAGLALVLAAVMVFVPFGHILSLGVVGVGLCGFGMFVLYYNRARKWTYGEEESQFVYDTWLAVGSLLAAIAVSGLGIVFWHLLK